MFADEDVFNDEPEESLIDRGMIDPSVPEDAKETTLVLYGSQPGTPGYRPPTAPRMAELATAVLDAHSEAADRPFRGVWEIEGTDNVANDNNAIGTLLGARYADEMIGVARTLLGQGPNTTILTAADGNAGGLEAYTYTVDEEVPDSVGTIPVTRAWKRTTRTRAPNRWPTRSTAAGSLVPATAADARAAVTSAVCRRPADTPPPGCS